MRTRSIAEIIAYRGVDALEAIGRRPDVLGAIVGVALVAGGFFLFGGDSTPSR